MTKITSKVFRAKQRETFLALLKRVNKFSKDYNVPGKRPIHART